MTVHRSPHYEQATCAGWGGRPPRPPATRPTEPTEEGGDPRLAALLSEADQLLAVAHHDITAAVRLEEEGVTQQEGAGNSASLAERLIMLHAAEAARDTRRYEYLFTFEALLTQNFLF